MHESGNYAGENNARKNKLPHTQTHAHPQPSSPCRAACPASCAMPMNIPSSSPYLVHKQPHFMPRQHAHVQPHASSATPMNYVQKRVL